jgi:hypothetical protein
MTSKRVPQQNVITTPTKVFDKNNPDLFWLAKEGIQVVDNGEDLFNQYDATFAAYLVASNTASSGQTDPLAPGGASVIGNNPFLGLGNGAPQLGDIENITGTIYTTDANNPKVKYVLKIRNSAIDKTNVVGVDARIYNPFA